MVETFFTDADLSGAGEFDEGVGLSVGTSFMFGVDGKVSGGRFRSPAVGAGSHNVGFYQITASDPPAGAGAGSLLNNQDVSSYVADSWVTQSFSTEISVTPGVVYRPRWHTSVGRYRAKGAVFNSGAIDRGNIRAVRDNAASGGFDLRNGTYLITGTPAYPKDNFNASAYFVDMLFNPDYYRLSPWRLPEFGSAAGRYSFGLDMTSGISVRFLGVYWYHPVGGTKGDINIFLDATSSPGSALATGSATGASLVDGWNYIPYTTPYIGSSLTSYTPYADLVGNGDHAYDGSVSLPYADISGNVSMTHTRYLSGGGFPSTVWDGGWHGIDVRYDFNTGGSGPAYEQWGLVL
jgi:hypothetical protein